MGRRPNQLVLEYFQRGRKLEDASNRYEHTCKRCGEVFPKGRVDNLTAHLLRRCSSVTQEDREYVLRFMEHEGRQVHPIRKARAKKTNQHDSVASLQHSVPETRLPAQSNPEATYQPEVHGITQPEVESIYQYELPFPLFHQQQTALDTLAEVSRRHLDYSAGGIQQQQQEETPESAPQNNERVSVEQTLMAQLQHVNSMPVVETSTRGLEGSFMFSSDILDPVMRLDHPSLTLTPITSPLIRTASAANEQVDYARSRDIILHPGSSPDTEHALGNVMSSVAPDNTEVNLQVPAASLQDPIWHSIASTSGQTLNSLSDSSKCPSQGFGLVQRTKTKLRGRFTDDRRAEVKENRKRGACIRCRMLKKPCSEGTPCNTCRSVETARLWKGKCLRTRMGEELTLWSIGYHNSLARCEVSAAMQGLDPVVLSGRIEICLLPGSDLYLTFAAKRFNARLDSSQSVNMESGRPEGVHHDDDVNSFSLLDEGEGISDKVEAYIKCASRDYKVDNPFMDATLQRARQHIAFEQDNDLGDARAPSTRSCYNLQNELLASCMELWFETQIITTLEDTGLTIQYESAKPPQHRPQFRSLDTATVISPNTRSYRLIKCQVLAAIESRCSPLARTVMNELERRLLQRQQTSRFATFLSAVILLSSVERMTSFYRALDPNYSAPTRADEETEAKPDVPGSSTPHDGPLNENPSKLWPQGEHFAQLLDMLLRMRALPPRTIQHPDGTLGAFRDLHLHLNGSVTSAKQHVDEQTRAATEWLDTLKLSVGELVAKRDGPLPGADAGMDGWDMRFISLVFLPEKMK